MSEFQSIEWMSERSERAREFLLKRPEVVPIGMMMIPQVILMGYFFLGWLFQRPPASIGFGPVLDAVAGASFIIGGVFTVMTARDLYRERGSRFPVGWILFTISTLLMGGSYVLQFGSRTAWLLTYLLCAPASVVIGLAFYLGRRKVLSMSRS